MVAQGRRRLLRLLGRGAVYLAIAAGSGPLLGQSLARRWRARRRHPVDLPPIPWIGHC